MKNRKFTMVELVVVSTILTILMTLLFGALANVKIIVSETACASNLKEIGAAELDYAGDHKYYTPGSTSDNELFNQQRWSAKILPYLGVYIQPTSWAEAYAPRQEGVMKCPMRENIGLDTRSYAINGFGYLKNYRQLSDVIGPCRGTGDYRPYAASPRSSSPRIPLPEIMFISELGVTMTSTNGYTHYSIRNGSYFNGPSDTEPDFRHDGKKNVLWLDFHVSTVEPYDMNFNNYLD